MAGIGKGELRLTPQRRAVLEVVRSASDHPTAAEIYERVKRRRPGIAYATVYNALAALVRGGQVLELSFGDAASHYDGRTDRHDHAVCVRCGRLADVAGELPRAHLQDAATQTGYQLSGYHTEFYGLCPSCASTR